MSFSSFGSMSFIAFFVLLRISYLSLVYVFFIFQFYDLLHFMYYYIYFTYICMFLFYHILYAFVYFLYLSCVDLKPILSYHISIFFVLREFQSHLSYLPYEYKTYTFTIISYPIIGFHIGFPMFSYTIVSIYLSLLSTFYPFCVLYFVLSIYCIHVLFLYYFHISILMYCSFPILFSCYTFHMAFSFMYLHMLSYTFI